MIFLRFSRIWKTVNLFIFLLITIISLVPLSWLGFADIIPHHSQSSLLNDKLLHMCVFFIITIWLSGQYTFDSFKKIGFLLFLFGVFIEIIQFVLPYRDAELLDLLANLLGIFIAIVVANLGYFGWLLKLETLIKPRS